MLLKMKRKDLYKMQESYRESVLHRKRCVINSSAGYGFTVSAKDGGKSRNIFQTENSSFTCLCGELYVISSLILYFNISKCRDEIN